MKSGLKIVVVNDEPILLKMFEVLIQPQLKDSTLICFSNSLEAWEELSRRNPDLLITGDRMPGLHGEEICRRLLAKQASYPIIVNSAWPPTEQWVKESTARGLNSRFLLCPFDKSEFQNVLEASLGIERKNVE